MSNPDPVTQVAQQSEQVGGNVPPINVLSKLPKELQQEVNTFLTQKVNEAVTSVKNQFQTQLEQSKNSQVSAEELKKTVDTLLEEKKKRDAEIEAEKKRIADDEAATTKKKKEEEDAKLTLTQKVQNLEKATDETIERIFSETEKVKLDLERKLMRSDLENLALRKRQEVPETELPSYLFPQISDADTPETFVQKLTAQKELYAKMKEDILKQQNLVEGTVTPLGTGNLSKTPVKTWDDVKKIDRSSLNAIKDDVFKKWGMK